MIILFLKLLLLFGLPIAITIFWQRRAHAHWNILLFALVAYVLNYWLRILLEPAFPQLLLDVIPHGSPPYHMEFFPPWIAKYFSYGLFREGTRWLLIRYVATSVRQWQDGIMFGIAYGSIVMLWMIGKGLYATLEDMGLFTSTLELVVANRSRPSYTETLETLNNHYFWWRTLLLILHWGVSSMIFNVGTCLAVVYSVQRRAVLPLLVTVLLYVAYVNSRAVMIHSKFVNISLDWLFPPVSTVLFIELGTFAFAAPCLLLILLLRKPMMNMEPRPR